MHVDAELIRALQEGIVSLSGQSHVGSSEETRDEIRSLYEKALAEVLMMVIASANAPESRPGAEGLGAMPFYIPGIEFPDE